MQKCVNALLMRLSTRDLLLEVSIFLVTDMLILPEAPVAMVVDALGIDLKSYSSQFFCWLRAAVVASSPTHEMIISEINAGC